MTAVPSIDSRGRKNLFRLTNKNPWHEDNGLAVQRGIWNPETGTYVWHPAMLRFLSKASISCIEEAQPDEYPRAREAA